MVTVEIWSDFSCPFCLIGKRLFEDALSNFSDKESVQVIYKSFQLDPKAPLQNDKNIYQILSEKYGRDENWAKKMTENVISRAHEVGIEINMDRIVPTNTLDAHCLAGYAQQFGLQNEIYEKLFLAYFVEGQNISDMRVLQKIGNDVGLDAQEVEKVLNNKKLIDSVREDQNEAKNIGVQGVPFFAFNREFAVSGAQSIEHFSLALEKAVSDFRKNQ